MKSNSQWQATKFASYLENYAKSFRFNFTEPGVYDFISNQLEKPVDVAASKKDSKCARGKEVKKVDKIINENKNRKYQEFTKKDMVVLENVQNMVMMENNQSKLLYLTLNSLNACKTFEVKLKVFRLYLDLLFKAIENSKDMPEKKMLSLEYYKACESSLRGFKDEAVRKELQERYDNDFRAILTGIDFETSKNHRLDLINFQMTNAEFCLHRENFRFLPKNINAYLCFKIVNFINFFPHQFQKPRRRESRRL